MTNRQGRHFLAEIDVCTRNGIARNLMLSANGMHRRRALRKAAELLEGLRKDNPKGFVSLHELSARTDDGKITYSSDRAKADVITRLHEEFHRRVHGKGVNLDGKGDVLEESAAYAYSEMLASEMPRIGLSADQEANSKTLLARHSVRLAFALTLSEPNGIRRSSLGVIRRGWGSLDGDSLAIGYNCMKNLICYIECLAVMRRLGKRDAERVLVEAITIAAEKGLHEARKFLLRHFPSRERDALNESYGVDIASFRFRSPYLREYKYEECVLS